MKNNLSTILITVFIVLILTPLCFEAAAVDVENPISLNLLSPAANKVTSEFDAGSNSGKLAISQHPITSIELNTIKNRIGVFVQGQNYNKEVGGRGTGLRPPTQQEWTSMTENFNYVSTVSYQGSLPSSIDQSATPFFPPIGNQGSQGSCVAWSIGYYTKTFQEAQEHGWTVANATWQSGSPGSPSQNFQNKIMSPAFVYNLANGGIDNGLYYDAAIDLVCSVGDCTWQKMPYLQSDFTSWPSEDAWTEAPLYRSDTSSYQYLDASGAQGLINLKGWIAAGNLATTSVDGDKIADPITGLPLLTNNDALTLDNYVNPTPNHAATIVGYNDNFSFSEQGQIHYGAFKIANSWGKGSWEHVADGFYWISYAAMQQIVGGCWVFSNIANYKPEIAASFSINSTSRSSCQIEVGLGNPNAQIATKYFNNYVNAGSQALNPNPIVLDITEFKNYITNAYNQTFFLEITNNGLSTITVNSFSVEYAQSTNTPCQIASGNTNYLAVTLPVFGTTWSSSSLVNSDNDRVDQKVSTATDNNGNLYVAYSDFYASTGKDAIYVKKSVDNGQTWVLLTWGYSQGNNLENPSIAIDPFSNNIFVALELEVSATEHQILVFRDTNNVWSWSTVASTSGQDYRYPSITSEYQYGLANRQYVSFETVYTNDDRDLMFAKTTDQGSTWTITKIHGNWPDSNVYCQTSITTAEGNLYIAYKFGADFNSLGEIRVERSTNFGATWTQFSQVDGLPNDCQFPSIAATHYGDNVIVAFQYQKNSNDRDIWYSRSINNGTTWITQKPLFSSTLLNEKAISLVAGEDGKIYAVCKAGRYAQYKSSANLAADNWTTAIIIGDDWIGDGLGINVRLLNNAYCPYVVWTDSRTKDISFADSVQETVTSCSLSAAAVMYGQPLNITGTVNASVFDSTIAFRFTSDNVTWNTIASGAPSAGSYGISWTPPNIGSFFVESVWAGDTNYEPSVSLPQHLTVNANYTIMTAPAGLQITIDGQNYDAPQSFNWSLGSTHIINTALTQIANANTRRTFVSWNDSGAQSHTVTVDCGSETFRADFTTQHYVRILGNGVNQDYSGTLVTVNGTNYDRFGFSDWITPGDTIVFSYKDPLVATVNGEQFVFGRSNASSPLTVLESTTVVGNYKQQYYLTVNSAYGNPLGQGWVDAGSSVSFGVNAPISSGAGEQMAFTSWTGTGDNSYNGQSNSQLVIMNNAVTETANWQKQFQVSFNANPASGGKINPSDSTCWLNEGCTLSISASSNAGYLFSSWTSTGNTVFDHANSNTASITISGPSIITGNFAEQPISTTTPNPTATPSSSKSIPTSVPSPKSTNASPTHSPSPTSTIIELSSLAAIVLFIITTLTVILLAKKPKKETITKM